MSIKAKTIGIIAEYNPFHNGHALQIQKIRVQFPNCIIVVIMSGFFLQRGQPALFDKWTRAELAVANGVNLVLELPFNFACRSAETFAFGGVFLLNSIPNVDYLAFGAETSDLESLQIAANLFANPGFIEKLKLSMKTGLSYPQALQQLMLHKLPPNITNQANNILAIEYLKALNKLKSNIQPLLIPREFSQYKDLNINSHIASASAIRENLKTSGLTPQLATTVPANSFSTLIALQQNSQLITEDNSFSQLLIYKLRNSTLAYIREHSDVSEGLEHSILKNSQLYNNYSDLLNVLTNKRYPKSRIARILTQVLIGLEKLPTPTYFRPLAFDKHGTAVLSCAKSAAALPVVSKLGKNCVNLPLNLRDCLNLKVDIAATNTYQLFYPQNNGQHNLDFLTTPKYMK